MIAAGVDQGTTASKAALIDADGRVTLLPERRHRTDYPSAGRVEQDPRELLSNVRTLVDAAAAGGERSIGLASQGETIIAWDRRSGEPIAPAIVWQDRAARVYADDGGAYSAGAAIEWLRRIGLLADLSELDRLAGDSAASRSAARRVPCSGGVKSSPETRPPPRCARFTEARERATGWRQ